MSNHTRVLIRRGARELSKEEVEQIKGQGDPLLTLLSVIFTHSANGSTDHRLDE